MQTPPLRISRPRDLLAAIPYQLGFVPGRSLVLVHLDEVDGTAGAGAAPRPGGPAPADVPPRLSAVALARADLPRAPGPDARTTARALTGTVAARSAPWAVAVVYDDADADTSPGGAAPGWSPLVQQVRTELAAVGATLLDAWHVGAQRYRSYLCADATCCPATGRDVDELRAGAVPAEAVWRGLVAVADRAELVPDLAPASAGERRAVLRAGPRWSAPPAPADLPRWRGAAWRRWRAVRSRYLRGGGPPTAQECAALLAGLRDVAVRDACLLDLAPGAAAAADAVVAGHSSAPAAAVLSRAADPALASATVRLAHDLAVRCDGPPAAEPLAVAAWTCWRTHRPVPAGAYAAAALARDPRHRLGTLVARALDVGLPPPGTGPRPA